MLKCLYINVIEPCFTLSSFVIGANQGLYLDSNTSLIFHPGSHLMNSQLITVINVENFSMFSYSTSAGIICDSSLTIQFDHTDFIFEAVDCVYLSNLNFFGCRYVNTANYDEDTVSIILIKVSISNLVL